MAESMKLWPIFSDFLNGTPTGPFWGLLGIGCPGYVLAIFLSLGYRKISDVL